MMDTPRDWIEWTPATLEELRKAHAEAVAHERETFMYDDHTFLTTYAKYLIEYLDGVFKKGK